MGKVIDHRRGFRPGKGNHTRLDENTIQLPEPDEAEPGKPHVSVKETSTSDIIRACNESAGKMSLTNPHRMVVLNAGMAVRQLVDYLHLLDERYGQAQSRVTLLEQVLADNHIIVEPPVPNNVDDK